MKKVLAFGASSSKKSINQQLALWAAKQLLGIQIKDLDLNDFEMPIYSIDREQHEGIPRKAELFKERILEADGIILSLAEHNGSYTAAFKNVFDWTSRIEAAVWANKPLLLLSASPGPRGALTVLTGAKADFPRRGGNVISTFSLPSFNQNFNKDSGILDAELLKSFKQALQSFQDVLI